MVWPWNLGLVLFKVVGNVTSERLGTVSYSPSIVSILYRFRDKARYWSKIAIFSYHPWTRCPVRWSPSEYLWKTRMMKKVWQYRFDTIHRCDRQTDTAQQHRPLFYGTASHGKKAIPMLFYIVSCNCRQTKLLCVLPTVNVYANHWVRSNCLHLARQI